MAKPKHASVRKPDAPILGVRIHSMDYDHAVERIRTWATTRKGRSVCLANVHTLMEAFDSRELSTRLNNSDLVLPDGMPLVWILNLKGIPQSGRVYGPTLMLHVLERAQTDGIKVGFYGGKPEVLALLIDRLITMYPGLVVSYANSPPFRRLSPREDEEIIHAVNASGAGMLFVGLGCPRQEIWMADHRDRIHCAMLGVGAAFDFHSGVKPQAPVWMQNAGLEWLFRLITEPERLWKRYLYHNPRFIFLAIADLLGILRYNERHP